MQELQGKKHLGDLLVEAGIITRLTLERALERQKKGKNRLGLVLEEMGVITEEELAEALAKQLGLQSVKKFASYSFPPATLSLIPSDIAVSRSVFPLKSGPGVLAVATSDPFDADTIDFLSKKTGLKVIQVLASRREIMEAVAKHYLKGKHEEILPAKKILVVEDLQSIATIIEVALSKEGFNVLVAHDGIDGLKLALSELPDLVICDSVMPRMDGYALYRALRENAATASIPVILLTSKATGEEEQKALEMGFIDFIAKPVQPIRVISRVKRVFGLVERMKS